jgi:hypothetical protein
LVKQVEKQKLVAAKQKKKSLKKFMSSVVTMVVKFPGVRHYRKLQNIHRFERMSLG